MLWIFFNDLLADRRSLPVVVDYLARTLDTHTQAPHKGEAIPPKHAEICGCA
jgi:hypothetical protein